MILLLVVHALAAIVAPFVIGLLGRRGLAVLAVIPAATTVWAFGNLSGVLQGQTPYEYVQWVPGLSLELAFRVDNLAWLMVLLVGGIGTVVFLYCGWYFSSKAVGLGRFAGVLMAFEGAMFGLVTSDNLLMLYVFWELTTVFSYLLIGHYFERKSSRRGAMQAIVITAAGGLAMLVGLIMVGSSAGTYSISAILASGDHGYGVAAILILVGAATKSALIPLHFWLPAAMAAPTPVSAYLHAAAMVKAGVYLVARFAPVMAEQPVWRWTVLVLGLGTLLVGGYRALRQYDLKLLLAYGTVSQLGLIITLVGSAGRGLALAGLAMIGAHAVFKAGLFLSVGVVDAACGTRDLRRISSVGRALPMTAIGAGLCTASMIALPGFAGFVAKEAAFEALLHHGTAVDLATLAVIAIGSILTVAYGLRYMWGGFATKHTVALPTSDEHPLTPGQPAEAVPGSPAPPAPITRPPAMMTGPAVFLGALSLVLGLFPGTGERLLSPQAAAYPGGDDGHLVAWAGFGPAFWLSAAVLAAGLAMFVWRRYVARAQASMPAFWSAETTYRHFMRRLDDLAGDVTGTTQRGSLPFYLGAIFVIVTLTVGTALFFVPRPTGVRLWDTPIQAVVVALLAVATIAAARSRRRLKAVIFTGVAGYGTAALFYLYGAPDLALTQVLVETISLLVFVLACRRLPPYFSSRPLRASRWIRLAVAVGFGAVVAGLALMLPTQRTAVPIGEAFPAGAYDFGGGKNIVNVTLVDIRAWDTMGEIAVLLVAATGVASMVFISRRTSTLTRLDQIGEENLGSVWAPDYDVYGMPAVPATRPSEAFVEDNRLAERAETPQGRIGMAGGWLRAVGTLAAARRSVILEVSTRLLFPTMIVYAIYLLFAGHNSPGGGFAAGLMVGLALTLRYLAGGRYELDEAMPVSPGILLGVGLFLSAGNGLLSLLGGGSVLETWIIDIPIPVIGNVHLVTSLLFDVGVFCVVVGLVVDILRSLGAELDRRIQETNAENTAGMAAASLEDLP